MKAFGSPRWLAIRRRLDFEAAVTGRAAKTRIIMTDMRFIDVASAVPARVKAATETSGKPNVSGCAEVQMRTIPPSNC